MSKTVLTLACAGVLLLASAELRAVAQGPAPEVKPAAPEAKPEGEATKPEGTTPGATPESPDTVAANGEPVSLGELTGDGFEIRATDYIPAEAVTRHSGKVSSDAIIVTLQKSAATAVCFYTLKAYVGKTLTTIPACTVHR
jgi:hypothetical protein